MQTIRMDAEEIRQFVRRQVRKHLKNAPFIDFPLPVPAPEGREGDWLMDLSKVDTKSFGPLIEVMVGEARLSLALKSAAPEAERPPLEVRSRPKLARNF